MSIFYGLLSYNCIAETTFETDELTGQLENRWSGQGHRAKLNRQQLNQEDPWESVDARYGEERRLFLQQRGASTTVYGSARSATGQGRVRDCLPAGDEVATRSFAGDSRKARECTAPPPRNATHARAPSPRSFGTVRFAPANRCADANGAAPPPDRNAALQSAKTALLAAAGQRNQVQQPTQPASNLGSASRSNGTGSKDSPLQAWAAFGSTATSRHTSSDSKVNITAASATAPPRSGAMAYVQTPKFPAAAPAFQSLQTNGSKKELEDHKPSAQSPWEIEKYHQVALWYAANPGESCDVYYGKYPERKKFLGEARDKLIKEAIRLVSRGDAQEIEAEIKHHKEREWMIDAAKTAKQQIEHGDNEDIEAYCATNPRHRAFIRAARAVFLPLRSKDTAQTTASPKAVRSARTEAQQSSSESATAPSSCSSDTDETAQTTASSPPRSGLGTLVASFFGVAGQILGHHSVPVQVPVHAHITVTSRKAEYNPRELIGAIESLAQGMIDRSNGLEGMRLADDGVWEDEELG